MSRVWLLLGLSACAASTSIAWRWWPALVSLLGHGAHWIGAAEAAAWLACLCVWLGPARSGSRLRAPVRSLLTGLGLSWSAFLLVVPAYERVWLELALGPAAGCVALVCGFEAWSAHWRPQRSRLARALLVALALAPPLGEAALRLVARWHPAPIFVLDLRSPGNVLETNRRLHNGPRFGFSLNSGGHYDEEFRARARGEQRVALIGDSFSQGIVPHSLHYSTLAEEQLGFAVDNFGVTGIGPLEYEELLVREALPLDPSAVVIAFFVGNDFELPPLQAARDPGLRSWLDRRHVLAWLVPQRLVRLLAERHENPSGIAGAQFERAQVGAGTQDERYPWLGHPELEQPRISKDGFLRLERERARLACGSVEEFLPSAIEALARMRSECGARPFGVLLIPDEFQIEDGLWAELGLEGLERDRPQKLLVRELGKRGIPVLDLGPRLRAVEPLADGKRHLYHLRDTHWNTRGNAVAGEALAGFVRALLAGATSDRR